MEAATKSIFEAAGFDMDDEDNKPNTASVFGKLRAESRDNDGPRAQLAAAVWKASVDLDGTVKSLRDKAEYIKREMDRALAHLDHGDHVPTYGYLQSTGVEMDRLCAQHQAQVTQLHMLLSIFTAKES